MKPLIAQLLWFGLLFPTAWLEVRATSIVFSPDASAAERLAAREIRRYLYLRTGDLPELKASVSPPPTDAIVVTRRDRPLATAAIGEAIPTAPLHSLGPQEFWLKTTRAGRKPVILVTGGDDTATLYGAYRLAEHLGVRFYLHGDVLPDRQGKLSMPFLDERSSPLFGLRGIQPFHDFPEGPDWWNTDDYLAVIAQLPKLRMNFFALHTYPEGAPHAEPTVWIGAPSDAGPGGQVRFSYPSSYNNTLRNQAIPYNWGYATKKTGDYAFGARELFEHDAFGPDVMLGFCPQPETPEACNTVFNRTADMLKVAFTLARRLGVKTCVGTETPLTIPKSLQERFRSSGNDPADPAVIQLLYEGIFARAEAAYPLDYYWFWTPEGWTWDGTKPEQVKKTLVDLNAALRAHTQVAPEFQLATCGWVLGPAQDRALFDKVLPKSMAVSCINREVGKTPVDPGFREVRGRSKWAIPWMEDDPALTSPQLWVGRLRRDAADARRYGCDGLMGIHWRTRVLAPNVAALAQAGWDQRAWNPRPFEVAEPKRADGARGGSTAAFPQNSIEGTDVDAVYQTVRYNLPGYHLAVPNGSYEVTLQFCEPHYAAAGKRIFQVHLQGGRVIERLDIFDRVGQNHALDLTFTNVAVRNGWLDIEFLPVVEFPSIAGIVVVGEGLTRRINCGGPAVQDYAADEVGSSSATVPPRVDDFYFDWAVHEFGPEVGARAAAILAEMDGRLPRPSDWVDGPGGIRPDPRLWTETAPEYAFVGRLEELQSFVVGAGDRARFDYWLETFRYHRKMGQVNCAWAAFNRALDKAKAATDPAVRRQLARDEALPLRRDLVGLVGELYQHLLATVSNPGELGTVMNWDQHNLPGLLTKPGDELALLLGEPLPPDALPTSAYRGPPRLIVPTVRTGLDEGEALRLKVIVLAETRPVEVALQWRKLGSGPFSRVVANLVARGVYQVELPAPFVTTDLEYHVEARESSGTTVRFPATAPKLNQTVVIMARD
ncbi:MAG: malectin domain-containing carbohydrate-binding protein [Limisphaerales bacterium]